MARLEKKKAEKAAELARVREQATQAECQRLRGTPKGRPSRLR